MKPQKVNSLPKITLPTEQKIIIKIKITKNDNNKKKITKSNGK